MNAFAASTSDRVAIHPDTSLGPVRLLRLRCSTARAASTSLRLGLRATELDDGAIAPRHRRRGPAGRASRRSERRRRSTPARPACSTSRSCCPSRLDLAIALARLAQARIPLTGASDHLVSEALYLSDPDGNGIEIYRDRPRDEWQVRDGGSADGDAAARSRLADRRARRPRAALARRARRHARSATSTSRSQTSPRPSGSTAGVLGFDVTVRGYPGALFVSAGGYHHHIGLNTWNSLGSPPPAPGAVGLASFEIVLPSADELDRVLERARGPRAASRRPERPDGWRGPRPVRQRRPAPRRADRSRRRPALR